MLSKTWGLNVMSGFASLAVAKASCMGVTNVKPCPIAVIAVSP